MDPLTESQVRSSFVNCSKGEAKRLNLPPDLGLRRWPDLDFLGWVDPRAPMQSYLVVPTDTHGLVGVRMRRNTSGTGPRRARMCSLCLTTHPGQGVSLMVAPRAGTSGREGNSVGLDICASLECSQYARGQLPLPSISAAHETLTTEERIARLQRNVLTFVARVLR
ncbi:MAG: FBP domain-containing protein [Nocardioides sp.]